MSQTSKLRGLLAACVLTAATVLAPVPTTAFAQRGVDLACSPTVANPCRGGSNSSTSGNSDRENRQQFDAALKRHAVVRSQLRAYVPAFKVEVIQPTTEAELIDLVDLTFIQAANSLDRLTWTLNDLNRTLTRLQQVPLAQFDSIEHLNRRGVELPRLINEATDEVAANRARAANAERTAKSLEGLSNRLAARSDRAAMTLLQWITVAAPKSTLAIDQRDVSGRRRAEVEETRPFTPIRQAEPAQPVTMPEPAVAQAAPNNTAPRGTLDERIRAAESLAPRFSRTQQFIESARLGIANRKQAIAEYGEQIRRGLEERAPWEQELKDLQAQAQESLDRSTWAGFAAHTQASNVALRVAEAYILETLRDNVVIPEVKKFLRANRVTEPITNGTVVKLYEARRTILPGIAGMNYKDTKRFMAVQARTLEVLINFEAVAAQAAETLSSGTDAEAHALAAEVSKYTDKTGLWYMEQAGERKGPLYKIFKAIVLKR
jgi:hypothetical protein